MLHLKYFHWIHLQQYIFHFNTWRVLWHFLIKIQFYVNILSLNTCWVVYDISLVTYVILFSYDNISRLSILALVLIIPVWRLPLVFKTCLSYSLVLHIDFQGFKGKIGKTYFQHFTFHFLTFWSFSLYR